jgi:DNA-binding XRE family transcriptional regulator
LSVLARTSKWVRRRPRDFEEWRTLAEWGRLPAWEAPVPGYQLRRAREAVGFTQSELAARLGVSQQAVARAERWQSNPTWEFADAWARALGGRATLAIGLPNDSKTPGPRARPRLPQRALTTA